MASTMRGSPWGWENTRTKERTDLDLDTCILSMFGHEERMSIRRNTSSSGVGSCWGLDPQVISTARTYGARAGASAQRKEWNLRIDVPLVRGMRQIESKRRVATGRREEQVREKERTSGMSVRNWQAADSTSAFRVAASMTS